MGKLFLTGGWWRSKNSNDVVNGRVGYTKFSDRAGRLKEATEILPEHSGVPPDAQTSNIGRRKPLDYFFW